VQIGDTEPAPQRKRSPNNRRQRALARVILRRQGLELGALDLSAPSGIQLEELERRQEPERVWSESGLSRGLVQ
jgi:hypothetical protein